VDLLRGLYSMGRPPSLAREGLHSGKFLTLSGWSDRDKHLEAVKSFIVQILD